jgi:hypothetical protein
VITSKRSLTPRSARELRTQAHEQVVDVRQAGLERAFRGRAGEARVVGHGAVRQRVGGRRGEVEQPRVELERLGCPQRERAPIDRLAAAAVEGAAEPALDDRVDQLGRGRG